MTFWGGSGDLGARFNDGYPVPQFFYKWVVFVVIFVVNLLDSTTRESLVAIETRVVCDICFGAIYGDTTLSISISLRF